MTGRTALVLIGVAAAVAIAVAPAAHAQCRLCETPVTARTADTKSESILVQVETGLDFDRLILLSPGQGSATLLPDGSKNVSGTIGAISGRAMVGQVRIHGEAGRLVRVELPERVDLYSVGGGVISIEEIFSDLPATPRLDANGALSFRFGGRLQVSGDSTGEFRGDIPITVEYL